MKKISKQYIAHLILTLSSIIFNTDLYAQNKKASSKVQITVHVNNVALSKNPLTLSVIQDYIHSNIGSEEYTVSADTNGCYRFTIPGISRLVNYSIIYQNLGYYVADGYLEPGDDVLIEFSGEKPNNRQLLDFMFSGNGSEKFIIKNILQYTYPNNIIQLRNDQKPDMKLLYQVKSTADSNYLFYKRILESYRTKITDDVYQIFDADIYGRAYSPAFNFLPLFFQLYPRSDPSLKDSILIYLSKLQNMSFSGFSPWALQSKDYFLFLGSRATTASILKYHKKRIQDIYRELIIQNTGSIREKALLNFLAKNRAGQKGDNLDSVYSDAIRYIQTPNYKNFISQLASNLKAGAKAYPFVLPDSTGKMVSLNDFKGKTVIIDCWFTGCGVCADLAAVIHEHVLPRYISDENVVFISVCADKSETMWKNSLKSGKYTNPKSINLFTEGLALKHPFMENYHFQSFPKLMLIDKNGNIFSSFVPRDPYEIITMIDKAIKEK